MGDGRARPLVGLDEAAEMLGMSRRTLERRIAAGEIAVFRDRRIVAIPSAEITRYVAERVARRGSVREGRSAALPSLAPGERLWD
jgi:excisionase family DNA binding protein